MVFLYYLSLGHVNDFHFNCTKSSFTFVLYVVEIPLSCKDNDGTCEMKQAYLIVNILLGGENEQ